ncbi:MAG: hypothetical protein V2I36_13845, partial [Desulfopila sp.]|nr:hypothetical protein [Desulfopila sp.]
MNTLETLYFPDTALLSDRQLPLFLFFSRVNIVQLLEKQDAPSGRLQDTFMDSAFCQGHTPHPLAGDKERFLYLINDIKNRKDDYAAQLSHITLASLSEKKTNENESRGQILSSLLGRQSDKNDQERINSLWQARLVLAIAEILDGEEEDVACELAFLEDSEADIFNSLKGSDEDTEIAALQHDLGRVTAKLNRPRFESVQKRLRAWFHFTQNSVLPSVPVWSTSREEVADILFENHEKKLSRLPEHIADILLPARLDPAGSDILQEIESFMHAGRQALEYFYSIIQGSQELSQKQYLDTQTEWEKLLDSRYPAAQTGRKPAAFYRFDEPLP